MGLAGPRGSRAWSHSCVSPHTAAGDQALQSWVTDDGQETSSKSDAPCGDEDAEISKGDAEVLSDGQVASDGNEGQDHAQIQNTLTGVSHVFGTHEETDTESNTKEKIQSAWRKRSQPSPKEDTPSKDSCKSSSEEEQPTDKARQWARQLDTNFDVWRRKKIAKGVAGWATRDTMICNLPKHGKVQPNHPDPVGPPLDYMGECQVFDGIQSDIYNLCQFYILGMTGDPPEFPAPREPATRRQIRDLLKSAHAISWPYLILAHSADSVTAISMLRAAHHRMPTTPPSRSSRQVGEALILPLLHLCDLSYLNHIIIVHYNTSYRCRKCLKQAFISSSALHSHKKVCLGLASKMSAGVSNGKPSSGGGDSGRWGSSKATPKKDGKAAATNSQGSSAPAGSQPSPCHSGWGTSHHHKSHKKDSAEKRKKANNASPAWKSAGHPARKDGGHR